MQAALASQPGVGSTTPRMIVVEVSLVIIAGDSRSAESELSETNRTRRPDQLFYALTILSVTCHVRLPHISESYIQDSPHRGPRRGGRVGEGRCVMKALAVLTTKSEGP